MEDKKLRGLEEIEEEKIEVGSEEVEEYEEIEGIEEIEEEKTETIITFNDIQYELKYNLKALESIEKITKSSVMGEMNNFDGILPLSFLKVCFSHALYKVGGGKISPDHGVKLFEYVLKDKGYFFVNMLVVTKIQDDCPFFFRGV